MFYYLVQNLFPESIFSNLLRYITARALFAAIISFVFVIWYMPKLIRGLQNRAVRQIVRDDGPKSHLAKAGTPTMGGLLMLMGIAGSILFFCRWDVPQVWLALFCLLSFGAVGFVDDWLKLTKKNTKGVSFRWKMITLGGASLFAAYLMLHLDLIRPEITIPFFKSASASIGLWFYLWAFLVMNGTSNAVNLTDGLDGLAIVPIMTTAFVLLITSYVTGHAVFSTYLQYEHIVGAGELTVVMASMIGVGLGFLWYNAHPASVFMGDVGSLGLGGLLGGVALMTKKELVLMLAGFLFVIEAVSVMLQVGSFKLRGKRIFKMAPLHHHFELSGWPESKVIVRFWILSILFALLALSTLKIR